MPKTFVSDQDTRSFLTPTLQFGRQEDADAYARERGWDTSEDAFKHFSNGGATYQPRAFENATTSLLTEDVPVRGADRPRFVTIRRTDQQMPRGGRNTCLLVEGHRQFHRYVHQTRKNSPIYYRFASGYFDCYAVWGREGQPLGRPLFTEDGRSVFVGRSGRGALYASVPMFNPDLSIRGYDTHLALVEFGVLDRNPSMDSVVRYTVRVMKSHGLDPNEPCQKPYGLEERLDAFGLELVNRAIAGFTQACQRMPKKLADEITFFLDQKKKADADARCYDSGSYRERVKKMGWQEALRTVEEAWQLEAVIHAHAGPEFDESPNYHETRGVRTARMLGRHTCSDERRAQLSGMISSFVAPRDNLWDYSGD